ISKRIEHRRRWRFRYVGRGKSGKSRLLDEFCEQHRYERKYAIKLLGKSSELTTVRLPPPGPEPKYEPITEVLALIWQSAEQPCGKRLAPALPLWLPHYQRHFGKLLPAQRKLLDQISPATIDRLLAHRKAGAHGLCGTRPGT